jgi:hypothetical protein
MKNLQPYLLTAALVIVSSGIKAEEKMHHYDIATQNLGPALQKLAAQSRSNLRQLSLTRPDRPL